MYIIMCHNHVTCHMLKFELLYGQVLTIKEGNTALRHVQTNARSKVSLNLVSN